MSLALCLSTGIDISFARHQDDTYSETRWLLRDMERRSGNKALKQLFEEGEERMPDLIRALYDRDKKVSLNSQVIIKYLATPEGPAAIEEWITYRKTNGDGYWTPNWALTIDQ
jgi:hypothetical protein